MSVLLRSMLRIVPGILLLGTMEAQAQLQVHPLPAELQPGLTSGRMVVTNTSERTVAIQARVFAWDQNDGEDNLYTTDAIALSPTVTEIPAGTEQIVRILRLSDSPVGTDQQYRIVIDELPTVASPAEQGTISVRLQLMLPLFDRAESASAPLLKCSYQSQVSRLSCRNEGGQAARLSHASLLNRASGDRVEVARGLLGYVLPGKTMSWPVDMPLYEGRTWVFETRLNDQNQTIELENDL